MVVMLRAGFYGGSDEDQLQELTVEMKAFLHARGGNASALPVLNKERLNWGFKGLGR